MEKLKELLSTFFYLGYSPVASGTVGSLGPWVMTFLFLLLPAHIPYGGVCAACFALFLVIGVPLGNWAEKRYKSKDPGQFVLDEVMAFFIPLIPYNLIYEERPQWDELVAAFFLSRLFDVIKPFPARRIERLKGGWGIMLDDLIAGLYALIALSVYHSIRLNPVF